MRRINSFVPTGDSSVEDMPDSRNTVDVLRPPDGGPALVELLDALHVNNIEVHEIDLADPAGSDTSSKIVLVLITEWVVRHLDSAAIDKLRQRYAEVVPVTFAEQHQDELFGDVIQIVVGSLGTAESARLLAVTIQQGGSHIVGWNQLTAAAANWHRNRQDHKLLLDGRHIAWARDLLRTAETRQTDTGVNRDSVREFVTVSRGFAAQRRRRFGIGVGVVATTLAAVLVFASVQTVRARIAQSRAEHAEHVATAARLSRTALQLIDGDPDLPAILTARALQLSDSDTVRQARAEVESRTWPHSSHALGYIPRDISAASAGPRVAITAYGDSMVRIYDEAGGAEIGRFDYHGTGDPVGGMGVLNDSGTMLATIEGGASSFKVFDIETRQQVSGTSGWQLPGDTMHGWRDDGHLMVGRGDQLLSVAPDTGESTLISSLPVGEEVRAAGRSANGRFVVATTDTHVVVADTVPGGSTRIATATDIDRPTVNDAGDTVYGIQNLAGVSISIGDRPDDNKLSSLTANASGFDVTGPYQLIAGRFGQLTLESVMTVRAHSSGAVRLARLSDGRTATVGLDGYLRIWQVPGVHDLGKKTEYGFITEAAAIGSARTEIRPSVSARNQIRRESGGTLVVTNIPGYTWIMRGPELICSKRPYFAGVDAEVVLSPNGKHLSRVNGTGVRIDTFDDGLDDWAPKAGKVRKGKPIGLPMGGTGVGIVAVDDSGSTLAMADPDVVAAWPMSGKPIASTTFPEQRAPVALLATADGGAVVLTADGYLRFAAGGERKLDDDTPRPATGDDAIAAGDFVDPSSVVAVTNGGTVLLADSSGTRTIGQTGAGVSPIAVRYDAALHRAAIMGTRAVVVIDTTNGEIVYRQPARGDAYVTDVAFAPDGRSMAMVTALGTVATADLSDSPIFTLPTPRMPTDDEYKALVLDGGGRG